MLGGAIYIEERLVSRLQHLELLEKNRVPACSYQFDDIFRWLEPHRGKAVGQFFDKRFFVDEVLDDVESLRALGQSSVSAWWWDYLDPTSKKPLNDAATSAYFQEKYRRIVLGYREVCERSLAGHLQNLGMYRALPMRWEVVVSRSADSGVIHTATTWRPVQSWSEAGCDVVHAEKIDFDWLDDDELTLELTSLGRYAGRHLLISERSMAIQFEQSNGYKASAGESVVLAEISDWVTKDIESLFREFGRLS